MGEEKGRRKQDSSCRTKISKISKRMPQGRQNNGLKIEEKF
jgi:hypothetical protein